MLPPAILVQILNGEVPVVRQRVYAPVICDVAFLYKASPGLMVLSEKPRSDTSPVTGGADCWGNAPPIKGPCAVSGIVLVLYAVPQRAKDLNVQKLVSCQSYPHTIQAYMY